MNKEQKQEVIEVLKDKFSQYSNFYITNTESLSVAQITNLRRHCFNNQVEMKVAKNTLIKKALESLDAEKYSGVFDSLHQVTALMFSESPKEPALIISKFRKEINGEKPVLKAAFLNGDVFVGDNQLINLTKIKTKNELIGEVIGLLMSPIQRVIGALQNRPEVDIAPSPGSDAPAAAESKNEKAQEKTVEVAAPSEAKKEPSVEASTEEPVEKKAVAVEAKTEAAAENKPDTPAEPQAATAAESSGETTANKKEGTTGDNGEETKSSPAS